MAKTVVIHGPYKAPKIPSQKQMEAQKQKIQKSNNKKK